MINFQCANIRRLAGIIPPLLNPTDPSNYVQSPDKPINKPNISIWHEN